MRPAERVARHDKLVKELKDLKSDSKAMEKRTQELVDAARLTITPAQAEQLILARWERTLYGTIDGYLKQYRQELCGRHRKPARQIQRHAEKPADRARRRKSSVEPVFDGVGI